MRELSLEELDQVAGGFRIHIDTRELFVSMVNGAAAGAVVALLTTGGAAVIPAALLGAIAGGMGYITGEVARAIYDEIVDTFNWSTLIKGYLFGIPSLFS